MCRKAYCVIHTRDFVVFRWRSAERAVRVCLETFDSDFEIPSKNVIAYETTTDTAQAAVAQFSVTKTKRDTNISKPTIFTKITSTLSGRHTRQRVIHNSYMNFTVVCCFLGGQREGTAENGSCLRNLKLKQNNKKNKHNRDAENGSMEIVFFSFFEIMKLWFRLVLSEKWKQTNSRVQKVVPSVKEAREIY